MSKLLSNPYVSRLGGAIGAGIASYLASHDVKTAVVTGVTFVVYGAVHSTATQTGDAAP